MGIGTLLNFDTLFYDFHLIAFSNSFWSAEGNMLLLFPGGFWYDAAIYIVIVSQYWLWVWAASRWLIWRAVNGKNR